MITGQAPSTTGVTSPWAENQPLSAQRLNNWQSRTIMEITVRPPLTMFRNGNAVTLGVNLQPAGGAAEKMPVGQYVGMFWGVVSNNVSAYAYPFAVQTV